MRISLPARRRRILILSLLALVAIAAALWAFGTLNRARSLASDLRRLDGAQAPQLAAADRATLEPIIHSLQEVEPRLDSLHRWLIPLRISRALLGWVPWLGDNLRIAPDLVERANGDVRASRELLEAAIELRDAYTIAAAAIENADEAFSDGSLNARVSRVRDHLALADAALAGSEAVAGAARPHRYLPFVRKYEEALKRRESSIRAFVDWADPAAETAAQIGALVNAAQPLLTFSDHGGISLPGRLERLVAALDRIEAVGASAFVSASRANDATPPGLYDSPVASHLRSIQAAMSGAAEAAAGAGLGLRAALPALEIMEAGELGLLADGQRTMRAIDALRRNRADFDRAVGLLGVAAAHFDKALSESTAADESGLVGRLAQFIDLLDGGLRLARDLPPVAAYLLGADGPRTYLVLGQTSDELRATGGFVSTLWLLTMDHGALVSAQYQDVVEADDLDNLHLYPSPPLLLREHMDAAVWLLRDVSWEPDFPSTAQIATELYRLGQRRVVDGVIAVTPWAFLDIARQVGSLPSPDGPIPADRLLERLETGTDREGRAYLDTILQSLISALNDPSVRARTLQVASAIQRALDQKQILMFLGDAAAQQVVQQNHWDGAVTVGTHDRLYIVDSNVGWSKVDRNIERSVHYRVELSRDQPPQAHLSLTYANRSSGNEECGQQWMDRGWTYRVLKNACYWNLVRAYIAPGAELVAADPLRLPSGSIFEQAGHGAEGEDTLELAIDSAGPNLSGLITVSPGNTRSVSFVYELPESVVDWTTEPTYNLVLQAQPGTTGRDVTIEIELPIGYRYAGSSIEPIEISERTVTFRVPLRRDTNLALRMQES